MKIGDVVIWLGGPQEEQGSVLVGTTLQLTELTEVRYRGRVVKSTCPNILVPGDIISGRRDNLKPYMQYNKDALSLLNRR
jgi:hypothetical protein